MKISEEQLSQIESVANTLRGMTFDRRLPKVICEVVEEMIRQLDEVTHAVNQDQERCTETKDLLDETE